MIPVVDLYAVEVGWIVKRQRQHALLLQVGLVDPGEAAHDDRPAARMPRRHRRVFPAAAFAVILIAHRRPANPLLLVVSGDIRQRLVVLARLHVVARARLVSERVVGPDEQCCR